MSAEKAQTDDERVESVVASSDIQTLLVLVDTLIKRTKRARAFALLRAVLRRFPSCATAYDRLINILLGKQRYEAARNLALLALGQGVHNWNIYLGLYEAYHGLGNGQAAVDLIHQGIVEFGPDHTVLKRSADILMTKKYFEEAHRIFEVIVFHYPDDCDALYNNAYAHHMLGRYQEALALNLKCLALEPRQTVYAFFHVNLLTSLRRFHEAIAQLRLLLAEYPSNATYRRTLSDILAQSGSGPDALREGLAAINLDPCNVDYWIHVAGLSKQFGFKSQAIEFMRRASELNRSDPFIFYGLAHHLLEDAQYEDARAAIDAALQLAPSESQFRDLRLKLIEHQRTSRGGASDYTVNLTRPLPRSRDSLGDRSRTVTLARQAVVQGRVVWGLTIRLLRLKNSRSHLGIVTVLFEPILHIITLWAVMSLLSHGRPPLGEHWFFFYATGIIPFLLVTHLGAHGVGGHQAHKQLLDIPILRNFDILLAEALTELIISTSVAVILFIFLYELGAYRQIPHFVAVIISFIILWIYGVGLMIINYILTSLLPLWRTAWDSLQRIMYFSSGIFFMAQSMPDFVRDILVWNPLLIGIEWFRAGFFPQYEPPWLDRSYLIMVSSGTFLIGMVLERALRRKLH